MTESTCPVDADNRAHTAPKIVVEATYKDPATGALYVHKDLVPAQRPWEEETHIRPMNVQERFGDVESFVAYVKAFGLSGPDAPLLTWNAGGLRATLDYASRPNEQDSDGAPGRCQWQASCPFVKSAQWNAWMSLASGQSVSQRTAIERLEDLGADIVEPAPADLMLLLRSLRATVNAKAEAELRPDGTTTVSFSSDQKVSAGKNADLHLPPSIKIVIPVLRGHVVAGEKGQMQPVKYGVEIRLRVSVDDSAKLFLRFSAPTAERILEEVYAERVQGARELLGENYALLRASD